MQPRRPPATKRRRGRDLTPGRSRERVFTRGAAATTFFAFGVVLAAASTLGAPRGLGGPRGLGVLATFLVAPLWTAFHGNCATPVGRAARVVLAAVCGGIAVAALFVRPGSSLAETGTTQAGIAVAGLLLAAAFAAEPTTTPPRLPPIHWRRRRESRARRLWDKQREHERGVSAWLLFFLGCVAALVAAGVGRRTLFETAWESPAWAAVAATLVATPLWFVAWQRRGLSHGRGLGLCLSAGATLGPIVCAEALARSPSEPWAPALAGALFGAAFLRAPAPPDREVTSDAETQELLRRHRESFPDAAR